MRPSRRKPLALWILVLAILFGASFACSKAEQPAPPAAAPSPAPAEHAAAPPAAPVPQQTTPAPAAPAPALKPTAAKPPVVEIPAPASAPTTAAAPAPAPAAAATPAAVSPAPQAAPAPPPSHAAVGSDKCKMCHRTQYDSWGASKHAAEQPPVACETCHGNGSDYASMSIMKDVAKAKAAGLVMPGKEFCTAKCHKAAAFTDDMLQKAHAHKAK